MRRILVCIQYFHEDKLSGYRRPANFMIGNADWTFALPSHRIDGEWAKGHAPWQSIEPTPVPGKWPSHGLFWGWLRYGLEYARQLRNAEPPNQALYMVSPPAWWCLPAALIARLLGIPSVLDLGDPTARITSGVERLWQVPAEWLLRRLSREVMVTSPDMVNSHEISILTGVTEDFFRVGAERLAKSASDSTCPPHLVYCGTFDNLRNLDGILRHWLGVLREHPGATLTLAGRGFRGPEEQRLRQIVEEEGIERNVVFAGWLHPSQVPGILTKVNWGLVSLDSEYDVGYAVPTKMLEYFAAGLPVLAVGGTRVRAIIEDSGGGVWVDPSHVSRQDGGRVLSEALAADRYTLGSKAHEYARANFTAKRYRSEINAVLRRCARPWSQSVDRGLEWIERAAVVEQPDLPDGLVGIRMSIPQPRIPGSDRLAYLEITAYAACLFLALFRLCSARTFLDRARGLVQTLLHFQTENGGLPFAYHLDHRVVVGPVYAFDTAMGLRAVLMLDRVDPDESLKCAARSMGIWLLTHLQQTDGSFASGEAHDTAVLPPPAPPCFYGSGGALHLKLALPLADLARLFREEPMFAGGLSRLLDWGIGLQSPDGYFPLGTGTGQVSCHTHSYALEGLWASPPHEEARRKGLLWSLRHLTPEGWMPRTVNEGRTSPPTLDATAQTLRLCALESRVAAAEAFRLAGERIARGLRKSQARSGGWPESPPARRLRGDPVWHTLFAVSALLYWERGDLEVDWLF